MAVTGVERNALVEALAQVGALRDVVAFLLAHITEDEATRTKLLDSIEGLSGSVKFLQRMEESKASLLPDATSRSSGRTRDSPVLVPLQSWQPGRLRSSRRLAVSGPAVRLACSLIRIGGQKIQIQLYALPIFSSSAYRHVTASVKDLSESVNFGASGLEFSSIFY